MNQKPKTTKQLIVGLLLPLGCALIFGYITLISTPADADDTTFRWTTPLQSPIPTGWTLHLGPSSGNYDRQVGFTAIQLLPDENGIYNVTVDVTADVSHFVAVQAFNLEGTSAFSNEITRIVVGIPPVVDKKVGAPVNVP